MANTIFNHVSYDNLNQFVYGSAAAPLKFKNGIIIGGGFIYPEIKFTLPTMSIEKSTLPDIIEQYKSIVKDICRRARELYVPAFVVEVELLPPMTFNPEWGIEITKAIREIMTENEIKHGLKSLMRITPNDIREGKEVVHMWKGFHWDMMMKTFEGTAKEGAEMLSIESVGGKEVHDDAIVFCDITKSLFALSIIGVKDMEKLWSSISDIARDTGSIPAGDTACGFGNTAMILAEKSYVPKVFAAVVRTVSSVRSLVAFDKGAKGPHKDCGYEGVFIKAITGVPISMEGKTSACAHPSPVGNVAAALADLWSNESIQNIKLLGGMAPTVSFEQLAYDCRLMNEAAEKGKEYKIILRDLLADSDSKLDPQAYVLRPDFVLKAAELMLKEKSYYHMARRIGLFTIEEIKKAASEGKVIICEREYSWLDRMESDLEALPDEEGEFIEKILPEVESEKFQRKKYDM